MTGAGLELARTASANGAIAGRAEYAVTVFKRMRDAEQVWRELECQAPATVYQRFDFLDAWQSTLGAAAGVEPHIAVAWKEGRAAVLLPFGVVRIAGVRTLGFLGGKHSNINFALIRRDFYSGLTPAAVEDILRDAIHADPSIGAVALKNMPPVWDGLANPLALDGCTAAAARVWLMPLEKDFATLLERRRSGKKTARSFRQKLNRLKHNFGKVEIIEASNLEQYTELIDTFLEQKVPWLAERGIKSDMAAPAFRDFLLSLARRSQGQADKVMNITGLRVGGKWVGTHIGASFQGCYSGHNSSLVKDLDINRSSPGEILMHEALAHASEAGDKVFNFGIGRTPQKEQWLKDGEPLLDLHRPVSARGVLLVSGLRLAERAKRTLNENPAWMSAVKKVREKLGGRSLSSETE